MLTVTRRNVIMPLKVFANSGKLKFDRYAHFAQDVLSSDPRQL